MSEIRSHSDTASALNKLAELASDRWSDNIARVLGVTREMLGMEVAFVSEFSDEQMLFRKLNGDAQSFGWHEGKALPLTRSFCQRVLAGSLPSVIPDAQEDGEPNGANRASLVSSV